MLLDNGFYIREDYLSTGEYFVIQIYELMKKKCKLIVIDELDISLDSSAQVNLLRELRSYCGRFGVNLVFTTHSLVLMKSLLPEELYYLEVDPGMSIVKNVSYSYIKSVLFGYTDYDKYILTEDRVLNEFIQYILSDLPKLSSLRFIVIHVGGSENTVDLMDRNRHSGFFSANQGNVLTVLDGDQSENVRMRNRADIIFLPFLNIEHALEQHYLSGNSGLPDVGKTSGKKDVYYRMRHTGGMTDRDIFEFLYRSHSELVEEFRSKLLSFLTT